MEGSFIHCCWEYMENSFKLKIIIKITIGPRNPTPKHFLKEKNMHIHTKTCT